MRYAPKLLLVLALLAALALTAVPAQATGGAVCSVDPQSAPVGTTFAFSCFGFSPNTIVNVYAVEPDGRASGINVYGFFPTSVKTDAAGFAGFAFKTEIPGFASVPAGDYVFVVHELAAGGAIAAEAHIPLTVLGDDRPLLGATLSASQTGSRSFVITGNGFVPGEAVNIWITQPPGGQCSGLGIDQLTLAALAGNSSSLWTAPGTVIADSSGSIGFPVVFRASACIGNHIISARGLGSGLAGEVTVTVNGKSVTETGVLVTVSPTTVDAFGSALTVSGVGFPANTGVNCWFTRPDGRVLEFINANAVTDSGGSFGVAAKLDDFPPYTSTEPGEWAVTCATPDGSALGIARFLVVGLTSDP